MTDDVVAIHELGHVFMAVALKHKVRSVQLGDNPRFDLVNDLSADHQRLDQIRILMAGCEAEAVVFDRDPIGGGSDEKQIAGLLADGDDEAALRAQVRDLLALNAGTIRYLAAKLARADMLDGDEVARIIRGPKGGIRFDRLPRPPYGGAWAAREFSTRLPGHRSQGRRPGRVKLYSRPIALPFRPGHPTGSKMKNPTCAVELQAEKDAAGGAAAAKEAA